MKREQIQKKIDQFNFPVFPHMLVEVRKVTADEHSSARDLAETILKDQSLTTKTLHIANSAYYGFYGNISTVTQAIVALGFDSVKNITFGLMAYHTLSTLVDEGLIRRFWEHSLATGVCAELLAEKIGHQPTEEALVAGLIHDVGKLLLVQMYPEEYAEVDLVMKDHELYSYTAEASILGITHAEVGRMMAEKWGLPKTLTDVISRHHQKGWGREQLTDIVSFADFMMQVLPAAGEQDKLERLIHMGSSVLNLKKESIHAVVQVLSERLEEYSRIFEIEVENIGDYSVEKAGETGVPQQKASLTAELPQKDFDVAVLSDISKAMLAGRPQNVIFQMVIEGILRLENADAVMLFLRDKTGKHLSGRMGMGKNAMGLCSVCKIPVISSGSVLARVFHSGRSEFLSAAPEPGDCTAVEQTLFSELEVQSAWLIPLTSRREKMGMLFISWDHPQSPRTGKQMETIQLFANQIALAIVTSRDAEAEDSVTQSRRSRLQLDLD